MQVGTSPAKTLFTGGTEKKGGFGRWGQDQGLASKKKGKCPGGSGPHRQREHF